MKTIAQQLNVTEFPFEIRDKNGNTIYWEERNGHWSKYENDEKGYITYYEDSDGYWNKTEFNEKKDIIYFENSEGYIEDNRPKPTVELTLEQIATKFGINVKDLKIVACYRLLLL